MVNNFSSWLKLSKLKVLQEFHGLNPYLLYISLQFRTALCIEKNEKNGSAVIEIEWGFFYNWNLIDIDNEIEK